MSKVIRQKDVSTRRTFQGAIECSCVVRLHLERAQYFGYTKREAVRMFVDAINRDYGGGHHA